MFPWSRSTDARVEALKAELNRAKRIIAVQQAEIDSLAGVIARDRMRVAAEVAIAARRKADAEGISDDNSNLQSSLRFG